MAMLSTLNARLPSDTNDDSSAVLLPNGTQSAPRRAILPARLRALLQQLGSPTHDSQTLLRHWFLLTSKVHLWRGSQHLAEHFNKRAHAVVTNFNSRLRHGFALGKHFKRSE